MTAKSHLSLKPCVKCGAAERYLSGQCEACTIERNRKDPRCNGFRSVSPGTLFLAALPATRRQIMDTTGISPSSVLTWQMCLRASGQIHVGSYEQGQGRPSPVYVRGPGKDAPKPPLLTPAKPKKGEAVKVIQKPKAKKKRSKVLVVPTVRQAQPARIALREKPRAPLLVEVALSQSRAVFPLSAVWG